MKATETHLTKKEDRSALRKKAKRFEQSRDKLKTKNREKAATIKKVSDRLTELESSRNHWRTQSSQATKKCRIQDAELKRTTREVDSLQEECKQLRQEVDTFKKKKMSRIFW